MFLARRGVWSVMTEMASNPLMRLSKTRMYLFLVAFLVADHMLGAYMFTQFDAVTGGLISGLVAAVVGIALLEFGVGKAAA